MSATAATESPKLKATLSMLPRASLLGKSATINVYPGKKSTKGNPKTMRQTLDGKKVAIIMTGIATMFMSRSSF